MNCKKGRIVKARIVRKELRNHLLLTILVFLSTLRTNPLLDIVLISQRVLVSYLVTCLQALVSDINCRQVTKSEECACVQVHARCMQDTRIRIPRNLFIEKKTKIVSCLITGYKKNLIFMSLLYSVR
jgi:hypothetical protein